MFFLGSNSEREEVNLCGWGGLVNQQSSLISLSCQISNGLTASPSLSLLWWSAQQTQITVHSWTPLLVPVPQRTSYRTGGGPSSFSSVPSPIRGEQLNSKEAENQVRDRTPARQTDWQRFLHQCSLDWDHVWTGTRSGLGPRVDLDRTWTTRGLGLDWN